MQSFITSNVLTEADFHAQLNTTFDQFIKSLIIDFDLLVDVVQLFTQVDQPYTLFDNANLIVRTTTNNTNDYPPYQVGIYSKDINYWFSLYIVFHKSILTNNLQRYSF